VIDAQPELPPSPQLLADAEQLDPLDEPADPAEVEELRARIAAAQRLTGGREVAQ
jgi:hypothetical protein